MPSDDESNGREREREGEGERGREGEGGGSGKPHSLLSPHSTFFLTTFFFSLLSHPLFLEKSFLLPWEHSFLSSSHGKREKEEKRKRKEREKREVLEPKTTQNSWRLKRGQNT